MSTLAEYQETYDGAPLTLDEFAHGAMAVTDCPELSAAAREYLAAEQRFQSALARQAVELG